MKPLFSMGAHLSRSKVERSLRELLAFRISQINGCAYCLDMHAKDLRAGGETEQRLYLLGAWREAPLYTARERAALAFAEALTTLANGELTDAVYEAALGHFTEEELVDLTMTVLATNNFNRINIAFRTPAGDYEPGQHTGLLAATS